MKSYRNTIPCNCNKSLCNLLDARAGLTGNLVDLTLPVMRSFIKSLLAPFLLASVMALAHHSNVMYDKDKEVTLKGTVKEFAFANPHVSILIAVSDANGVTTDWTFEGASTRGMVNAGWRKSTLKPGDSVTIVGHPLRDGQHGAQLLRAILSDGTILQASAGGNY
jgi:hypothetical protein